MERRELLKMIAILTGGAVIGADVFLTGCTSGGSSASGFTPENIALLDEIGETILPATDIPGAKATQIGEFMKVIVTDCYTDAQQKAFGDGLAGINEACKKLNGKGFMDCDAAQRKTFLVSLEKEAKEYNKQRDEKDKPAREKAEKTMDPDYVGSPSHYYTMMKQLTLWGYFSSEIGSKQALRFLPIPGRYDGALPYKKGDKAWAI
ncbi:MAG: gluconate 2-dehydrogenase subunit 3 family protein [Ferruginibacter sp.]